ncbi:hypothetical protein H6G41_13600 [Tolypothrix sp. FACHB-123]|nr:element excision factor XisH family protein [Tolypothrix sp. FACHB-123]MBD2355639.1 hypothetical protein [Tolypothrix sp. FACHB-123]
MDDIVYFNFFQRPSIQLIIRQNNLQLIIVDTQQEEIVQWIP